MVSSTLMSSSMVIVEFGWNITSVFLMLILRPNFDDALANASTILWISSAECAIGALSSAKGSSLTSIFVVFVFALKCATVQNPFLTAQSTQIKSVISVPIKDFIHHYPRALFNDIPMVGAHFYDIPGSGRTFTTYPGRDALLRHTRVGTHFYDIPGSGRSLTTYPGQVCNCKEVCILA